jgi:hypothetical protein
VVIEDVASRESRRRSWWCLGKDKEERATSRTA